MSTKNRYMRIVWRAVRKLQSDDVMGGTLVYRTAGQIAEIGEVSTQTARKYLEVMVTDKAVHKITNGKTVMYGVNLRGDA